MEMEIDRHTIKEIEDIILEDFVSHYAGKCTDISAIAVCLQAIIDKVDELKKELED